MEFNKEELEFLLVIIKNQIEVQKFYRKNIKIRKNLFTSFVTENHFNEAESTLKFLVIKIESFLKDYYVGE